MGEGVDPRVFGALERDVKHLTDRIEKLESAIDRLGANVSQLTDLLNQARGARIMLGILIAIPSFMVGVFSAARLFR